MPVSTTRWNCILPAERATIVTSHTAQLRWGERATARKRSAIWRHAAVTGQRPQETGMNKLKLRLIGMNVRDLDTSLGSVLHDWIGRQAPQIRLGMGNLGNLSDLSD